VASSTVHGGTYHQFKVLAPQLGIACRFVASNEPEDFRALLDDKTTFIFVESISNPKYTVPDFEALADIAHSHGIPLICDNTFGCAGYYCRPIEHGADIVVHFATIWIDGHGTTLRGDIVDGGNFDWGQHADKFPQFRSDGAQEGSGEVSLWKTFGRRAFAIRCHFEVLRGIGSTMSPQAAQQLLIGLESLAVRCDRPTSIRKPWPRGLHSSRRWRGCAIWVTWTIHAIAMPASFCDTDTALSSLLASKEDRKPVSVYAMSSR
ncbi:uncharacterized protein P174DRAFT_471495, partial [Aspergillus novofumigatus IBT 16806]